MSVTAYWAAFRSLSPAGFLQLRLGGGWQWGFSQHSLFKYRITAKITKKHIKKLWRYGHNQRANFLEKSKPIVFISSPYQWACAGITISLSRADNRQYGSDEPLTNNSRSAAIVNAGIPRARLKVMHRLGELRGLDWKLELSRQRTDVADSGEHIVEHGMYRKSHWIT